MATYTLPELRYDYSALEPHISARIMELHHDKHHAAYVKGANTALDRLAEARDKGQFDDIGALEKALAFHLSGHVLHSVFWKNMAPEGGRTAAGRARRRDHSRNSAASTILKKQMNAVAASIMGSGWAALVWEPLGKKLLVTQIYDHQSNLAQAGTPCSCSTRGSTRSICSIENRKDRVLRSGVERVELGRRRRALPGGVPGQRGARRRRSPGRLGRPARPDRRRRHGCTLRRSALSSLKRLEATSGRSSRSETRHPAATASRSGPRPAPAAGRVRGAARWLLSGPRLRALINTDPESLTLDYDEATSLWPGRVTIRNLRIRGSDHNVQWIIRLADARVDYSVLALAQSTFRAERVRGDGLSFSVRNKLEAGGGEERGRCPYFRPFRASPIRRCGRRRSRGRSPKAIPGASTSGRSPSTTSTTSGSTLSTTAGRRASTGHSSCARACSSGSDRRACASRAARLRIGRAPVGDLRRRDVSTAPFQPFEPPIVHGSEVWQKIIGRRLARRRLRPARVAPVPLASRRRHAPRRRSRARQRSAAPSSAESRRATSGSASRTGRSACAKLTLHGNADLRLLIPAGISCPGRSRFREAGSPSPTSAPPGRTSRGAGGAGSTCAPARSARRRRRPSTADDPGRAPAARAAFRPSFPPGLGASWISTTSTATASVDTGPSLTRVRGLDARGGNFRVQGHYLRRNADRERRLPDRVGRPERRPGGRAERDEAPAARREAVVRRTARRRERRAATRRPRRTTRLSLDRPSPKKETPGG